MGRLRHTSDLEAAWARLMPDWDLRSLGVAQRLLWTGRLLQVLLEASARAGGIRRRSDYEVLTAVRRAEGESPTPAEIASELSTSASGMTAKLDRLEARGLVERTPDLTDRRIVRVTLTEPGRIRADESFLTNLTLYDEILETLSEDELRGFDASLRKVLAKIEDLVETRHSWR